LAFRQNVATATHIPDDDVWRKKKVYYGLAVLAFKVLLENVVRIAQAMIYEESAAARSERGWVLVHLQV
jgi:hypothetical protein